MKFNKKLALVSLLAALFGLTIYVSDRLEAKGPAGEYSARVAEGTTFTNPNSGVVLDSSGTINYLIEDVYRRMFNGWDKIGFNNGVLTSTSQANSYIFQASSQTLNFNQFNWGWSVAIPTASVNSDRVKVRLHNPTSNLQRVGVNVATSTISGALSYPSTNYFLAEITPGNSLEVSVSSLTNIVFKATGTYSGELINCTEIR